MWSIISHIENEIYVLGLEINYLIWACKTALREAFGPLKNALYVTVDLITKFVLRNQYVMRQKSSGTSLGLIRSQGTFTLSQGIWSKK